MEMKIKRIYNEVTGGKDFLQDQPTPKFTPDDIMTNARKIEILSGCPSSMKELIRKNTEFFRILTKRMAERLGYEEPALNYVQAEILLNFMGSGKSVGEKAILHLAKEVLNRWHYEVVVHNRFKSKRKSEIRNPK